MSASREDDAELWSRAQAGDQDAFGRLFERHVDAVYNHCFRRTASWSTAEDLTSVVFMEVWRHRRNARLVEGSVLPWLLGVANNVIRNSERSTRRHHRMLARLRPAAVASDFADDTAARLDDEQAMRRVLTVINLLNEDDREVLSLCVWAGLRYEEAALALDLPVGTVRSRLSRARERLRRLVGSAPSVGSDASRIKGV